MAPVKNQDEAGFKRLVDIESEYRTQRPADQLHAIACFPQLFDEFPFPVIINAAILKLADYFRNSNNIQRHAILQVFKKSQPHLRRIMNVEETIKRISPMLQSNDPLARAITLRVLGCMSTIVYDRIDVYHNVIHSLDSSEAMEVSAAIYAADRICAQSQRFCAIISGKLAFMVRDPNTPLPLRRRLIRIFGHMFEDITLARLARKTCLDILDLNQDGEYTVAILRTLTKLASHSLVDVQQQIELLLQKAQAHPLVGIRRVSLMCLGSLSLRSIEFSPEQIKAIFEIALESIDEKTTLRAVSTLYKIFCSNGVLSTILLEDSGAAMVQRFLEMGQEILRRSEAVTGGSKQIQLESFSLFSVMLPGIRAWGVVEGDLERSVQEAAKVLMRSMELFLSGMWALYQHQEEISKGEGGRASTVLSYWVSMTLGEGPTGAEHLVQTLLEWINLHSAWSSLMAKALLHVARQVPLGVQPFQDQILALLERLSDDAVDHSKTATRAFILIYRALLEAAAVYRPTLSSFEGRVSALMERFGDYSDMTESFGRHPWEVYQLGRYAFQTGWATLGLVAIKGLVQQKGVQNVPYALWLSVLETVGRMESSLQVGVVPDEEGDGDGVGGLDLFVQQQMYAKVIGHLEEIEAYRIDRSFQLEWCSLRRRYLQTCQLAVTTVHLLSTSLLSSFSSSSSFTNTTLAVAVGLPADEDALIKCADKFNQLAHQYTLLRGSVDSISSSTSAAVSTAVSASAFEVSTWKDQHGVQTDVAIEVLQTLCLVQAYALQRVAKILGRTSASASAAATSFSEEKEEGIFDIDPLLIPLLFQEMDHRQQPATASSSNNSNKDHGSFVDFFRTWTRMTLSFLNSQILGRDRIALEKSLILLRQLLSKSIAFPIPIPQQFFVHSIPFPLPPLARHNLPDPQI